MENTRLEKNSSRKKFNICCKILVTGLISTPLYLENGKTNTSVGILYKEHFTRNIKGNNHQICLKNKSSRYKKKNPTEYNILASWGFSFPQWILLPNEKQIPCKGSSNEQFHKVWFQLANQFWRRSKCDKLMTLAMTDAKWWQYLTWLFGST